MSRYAYLVCRETKRYLFLGSIVGGHEHPVGFWRNLQAFEERQFAEVLSRFLAESMNRQLLVLPEELIDETIEDDFTKIGGDAVGDIPFAEYLKGDWE